MITATGSSRILQERRRKATGSCRKALEITGTGSSIPTGTYRIFFRWIPVNSLSFPAGIGRKSSEKIRKFSGGNTASTFQRFPVLSCRNQPVFFDLGYEFEFACQTFKRAQKTIVLLFQILSDFL